MSQTQTDVATGNTEYPTVGVLKEYFNILGYMLICFTSPYFYAKLVNLILAIVVMAKKWKFLQWIGSYKYRISSSQPANIAATATQ